MKSNDIVVIADTQVIKGADLSHIRALAKYILKYKPKYIVHIGDNWDFESLSFYASALEAEGRRLVDDLVAGEKALAIISDAVSKYNDSRTYKKYEPIKHFIMGNHEKRLQTMTEKNPHLVGLIDLEGTIEKLGWAVHEFLHPCWIEGICFNHFMPNPFSGKPVGGSIENKLNKYPHSLVHGHVQQYQFGRRQTLDGRPHFGVCAGSFYMHDEGYRGSCNTEIRGFVHMKSFINRYNFLDYDVDFVSLERLISMAS